MEICSEIKQILFLSADMTNSTALKNESDKWSKFILTFRESFEKYLRTRAYKDNEKLSRPVLWKSIGDELVFMIELQNKNEAKKHLIAFRDAIYKYNDLPHYYNGKYSYIDGLHHLPKDISELLGKYFSIYPIKGTAWVVSFPQDNLEIIDDTFKPPVYDYIGPDVDLGFRLSKKASERKLIISVELALLLLSEEENTSINFYYDSKDILKGVIKNKPYPIIWIDVFEIEKHLWPGLPEHKKPGREIDFDDLSICDNTKLVKCIDEFTKSTKPELNSYKIYCNIVGA